MKPIYMKTPGSFRRTPPAFRWKPNGLRSFLATLLFICSTFGWLSAQGSGDTKEDRANQPDRPSVSVPPVDLSKHDVPLEQIFFDTFQPGNRGVALTAAPEALIERLRDAIPPIHDPKYVTAPEAAWLGPDDVVIGYSSGGESWAFPVKILNYHEIVNTELDNKAVLISYCPLCYSGIVFSRTLEGEVLTFGNTSALYESDMVMLDYGTGSYWWQVAGRSIVGTLTGKALTILPSVTIPWKEWRALHPQTAVLSRDTGHSRNYDWDPFVNYSQYVNAGHFAFPVSTRARDTRLPPAAKVIALKQDGEVRVFPLDPDGGRALMDLAAAGPIVVFTEPTGPSGRIFRTEVEGRNLSFEFTTGGYTDRETGSRWDLEGRAVSGPLKGRHLQALPSMISFWFALIAAEPELILYSREIP
jgi:hypothetical protein